MKVSRLLLLLAAVCLLDGLVYADTIPLGDPPGITIRPGDNYAGTVNPIGEGNTLSVTTDAFGFADVAFTNGTDQTFLSASFSLTLLGSFDPGKVECDTSLSPDQNPVFLNCQVKVTGPNSVFVTFSGVGEQGDKSSDDKHQPGLLSPLGSSNNPCDSVPGDEGQDDRGSNCGTGIPPGFSFEVVLDGGSGPPCGSTADGGTNNQCGFLDNHTFTGQLFTTASPVPEPGTMALLLAGLGALTARKRSRKHL